MRSRTSTATTSTTTYSSYPRPGTSTPAVRPGLPGRSAAAADAGGVDPGGEGDACQHERGDREEAAGEPMFVRRLAARVCQRRSSWRQWIETASAPRVATAQPMTIASASGPQ